MVQAARLDLSVPAALALALLSGPALAQDAPLTTLMRPQPLTAASPLSRGGDLSRSDPLFGADPLASVNALSGTGSLSDPRPAARPAKPGEPAAACDPRARRPAAFGLASGGSGPGEYSRYVETGRDPEGKPPASQPPTPGATPPGDRPLYGDTSRPLWSDATPSPASRNASRAGAAGDTRPRPGEGARADGAADAPAPSFDRPLWGDAVPMPSAGAQPCQAQQGTQPPGQSLSLGSEPAR